MSNSDHIRDLFESSGLVKPGDEKSSGLTFDFQPLYDRLLVRVIPNEDRKWNGLIIPAFSVENTPHLRGVVLAVGHGRVTQMGDVVPLVVKVNDVVSFLRIQSSGEQVMMPSAPGVEMWIIPERHILGIYSNLPQASGVVGADGRELVS